MSICWASAVNAACGISRASFAIRPSFVDTVVEPDVSAIFPSNVPAFRCLLPSTGSLGLVPPLLRYYQALRLPAALPRRFVAFAPRYRRCALGFAPAGARRSTHRPGVVHRTPQPVLSSTETTGPPRFLEDPTLNVPCSLTPAGPLRSATTALRCCLPLKGQRRLPLRC